MGLFNKKVAADNNDDKINLNKPYDKTYSNYYNSEDYYGTSNESTGNNDSGYDDDNSSDKTADAANKTQPPYGVYKGNGEYQTVNERYYSGNQNKQYDNNSENTDAPYFSAQPNAKGGRNIPIYGKDEFDNQGYGGVNQQKYEDLQRTKNQNEDSDGTGKKALFILWFLGSVVASMALAKTNPMLTTVILGQIFFVLGIKLFLHSKQLFTSVFMYIGALMIILPVVSLFYTDTIKVLAPIAFLSVFIFVGVSVPVSYFIYRRNIRKRCSIHINATIVSMQRRVRYINNHISVTFAPVYQFVLDGRQYCVESPVSSSRRPQIGKNVAIFINPQNPQDINDSKNTIIISVCIIIISAMFLFLGTTALILFIFNTLLK